jgi:Ca2+-binding RTX toxin-like protein
MIGYDGTPDGVTIDVQDGEFQFPDGPFPTLFNASNPDLLDISSADFAWSAIEGKVDSNGNEAIGHNDCHVGVINGTVDSPGLGPFTGGVHILGNTSLDANECGFVPSPAGNSDGLVDLNGDIVIDTDDTCTDGCFFGLDVVEGFVQEETTPPSTCPGFETDPRNQVVGTAAPDDLVGTAGDDIICGLAGGDTMVGGGGNDLMFGNAGADVASGGRGADEVRGGIGPDDLFGNGGNDDLFGGTGNDDLDGGLGSADLCRGGPGRDRTVRCEV